MSDENPHKLKDEENPLDLIRFNPYLLLVFNSSVSPSHTLWSEAFQDYVFSCTFSSAL